MQIMEAKLKMFQRRVFQLGKRPLLRCFGKDNICLLCLSLGFAYIGQGFSRWTELIEHAMWLLCPFLSRSTVKKSKPGKLNVKPQAWSGKKKIDLAFSIILSWYYAAFSPQTSSHAEVCKWKGPAEISAGGHLHFCDNREMVRKLRDTWTLLLLMKGNKEHPASSVS